MLMFKIGDRVKVKASKKTWAFELVGKIGVVSSTGKDRIFVIDFDPKGGGDTRNLAARDLELVGPVATAVPERTVESRTTQDMNQGKTIPVSHKDYMSLSDAYDIYSRDLMGLKGEEYAIKGDFLAMENRLAGMLGDTPEYVSLVMAGKHITALGIILEKNDPDKIKLAKLDERVRDATNLLKIMAAFIHAKQDDFSLHLGKEEQEKEELDYQAAIAHETGADRTAPTEQKGVD